jgi:hypothetical protein
MTWKRRTTVYQENAYGKPWKRQMSTNQLNKLLEIYINKKGIIKIRSNLSNEFCNTNGLLQGCPMSPILFQMYTDTALKECSRKCKRMGLKI